MPLIVSLGDALTCGKYRQMYDLDAGVGMDLNNEALENRPTDILLLQFMFQQVFAGLGISPPGSALATDGKFGPLTHYWILYFQMCKRHSATPTDDDGFVAPFHEHASERGWIAAPDRSTMFALNYQLQKRLPNFDKLPEHPALPAMLRGKFKPYDTRYGRGAAEAEDPRFLAVSAVHLTTAAG